MKNVVYDKPFLTIDEQVDRLESRGMIFPDRDRAPELLRKVGYYRLSGYWHLFRELDSVSSQASTNVTSEVLEPVGELVTDAEAEARSSEHERWGVLPDGSATPDDPSGDRSRDDARLGGQSRSSEPPAVGASPTVGAEGDDTDRDAPGSHARPPERRLSTFVPGTSFDEVERIYHFDRTLRMHVFDAIEVVEVALRARVGYLIGQGHAFAHRDPHHLHSDFTGHQRAQPGMEYSSWLDSRHAEWLRHIDREEQRSAEPFVTHIREKYNSPLPVWAATEVMSFGTLAVLYSGMDRAQQNRVAAGLGVRGAKEAGEGSTLANWLEHLRYVRNTCAHHARLWNRNMTVQLAEPSRIEELDHLDQRRRSRVYGTLAVLSFLLARVDTGNRWRMTVADFIEQGTKDIQRPMSAMGFPDDWREQAVWGESYTHPDPAWEQRQEVLDRLPSLTAGEMGRLMRPELDAKDALNYMRYLRQKGWMLGLLEGSSYVYPQFQVDAQTSALHPVASHANQQLLGSVRGKEAVEVQWRAASWWSARREELGGRSPAEALTAGRLTMQDVEQLVTS